MTLRKSLTYFNPRAPYGARQSLSFLSISKVWISIHAPHTGRDLDRPAIRPGHNAISIHAPHTGRDTTVLAKAKQTLISIHAPHTGRDWKTAPPARLRPYFNPRAPYGARRAFLVSFYARPLISIHAPHTGRDAGKRWGVSQAAVFQSTRPIRGATCLSAENPTDGQFQSTRPIRGAT